MHYAPVLGGANSFQVDSWNAPTRSLQRGLPSSAGNPIPLVSVSRWEVRGWVEFEYRRSRLSTGLRKKDVLT